MVCSHYNSCVKNNFQCTEDNHPDKTTTEEAWKAMTNVASYINEYKRRRDIVSKYLDNDNTLIGKMSKLSMHSVAKMSTRLSTRLSATLGLTNVASDTEFEELEKQFRSIEKCTWQLAKDVEQCTAYLNDEAMSGEVIAEFLVHYYQGTPTTEVKKLRQIRSTIWSQYVQDFKSCIEKRVSAPLHFLTTLLEGPAVLVAKRHDKLLDYDAAISKSEKYKESKIVIIAHSLVYYKRHSFQYLFHLRFTSSLRFKKNYLLPRVIMKQ